MNNQLGTLLRSALKIGGTAAVCVGAMDPQLGAALQSLVAAVGSVATSAGLVWSWYTHRKPSA